jgi:hypothetical protein
MTKKPKCFERDRQLINTIDTILRAPAEKKTTKKRLLVGIGCTLSGSDNSETPTQLNYQQHAEANYCRYQTIAKMDRGNNHWQGEISQLWPYSALL